ncbi:WSC domain-containing protein [Obelidium mucronatum]|nr:WSC domain-containing protein [Obelidium mucronatum]
MTCEGDRAQFCGGSGAISVYSNLNPVPVAPQAPDIPAGFRYAACYRDDNFNRLLTNKLQAQQGMTVGLCGQLAVSAGYTIFGVEYASECWAASLLAYFPSGSDQCNMACQGRNDQICGGPGALSVYTNQGSLPVSDSQPTNSAPAGFQYINCYQDSNSNRLLVNRLSTSQGMTIEVCAQLARASGFNTFGVEYSSECWAANVLGYQPSGSVQCSMRCQGDNSKLCGGSGALSVYSTSSSLSVASAASNPTPPPGFQFYGCYEDITWNRLIPNRLASRQDMTVALCAQLATAAGYKVFGVEWSVECWGSNGWAYTPSSSNNCNMRCGGDESQLCGGSLALSVYAS